MLAKEEETREQEAELRKQRVEAFKEKRRLEKQVNTITIQDDITMSLGTWPRMVELTGLKMILTAFDHLKFFIMCATTQNIDKIL